MGFYTTLYLFSKLFTGGKKKEEPGASPFPNLKHNMYMYVSCMPP